ncbi:Cytochrome b-c1 complex subunit Rieske, partial [Phytophthora palmivora]
MMLKKLSSSVAPRCMQTFQGRAAMSSKAVVDTYESADHYFEKDRIDAGDPSKRAFTYFMLGGARVAYATAARLAVVKFVGSMSASADVLALATAEFDLSNINEGATVTVKWRGKPIFIKHRTAKEIDISNQVDSVTGRRTRSVSRSLSGSWSSVCARIWDVCPRPMREN